MKDCGDCFHITFNENDQNFIKAFRNKDVKHDCKKYKVQLFHQGQYPLIIPCTQCQKENGFESFSSITIIKIEGENNESIHSISNK